jgi:protoheme ferro-lyase
MATVAPPVTQSSMGSKGPTAMVFMNMGGPSTTDQVGDFLSRLFVSSISRSSPRALMVVVHRQMVISFHSVDCNHISDL